MRQTVIIRSDDDLDAFLKNTEEPLALVLFFSNTCERCNVALNTLPELAQEFQGKLRVGRVNIRKYPALATRETIEGNPTFILFQNEKEISRIAKCCGGQELRSWIVEFLDG